MANKQSDNTLLFAGLAAVAAFLFIKKKTSPVAAIGEMKKNDKEFEELQRSFESSIKKFPTYVGAKAEREPRDSSHYYSSGAVNSLFIAYMFGYEYAKALARLDALDS